MPYNSNVALWKKELSRCQDLTILALESSCDDTASAVVKNGRIILSADADSQIMEHRKYGGVVPEVAARSHLRSIDDVVDRAMENAGVTFDDIDAIAVTCGPGLVGALLSGVSCAKALAFSRGIPLVGVHHIKGHIAASYLEREDWQPPFIALVVSGGHSHLALVRDYDDIEWLGRTRDDSAGEAFDKVARVLGLPYPGGPEIDRLAKQGDASAIRYPVASVKNAPLDMSFSGLKTAVIQSVENMALADGSISSNARFIEAASGHSRADIAASFQKAVVDALSSRALRAMDQTGVRKLAVVGGVASNSALRNRMEELSRRRHFDLCIPKPSLCTDNAAMIASAGYYAIRAGKLHDMTLNAAAVLDISH
ncbi:MAG: tRNA (adenosine(37)-N6)-threonylcarbamoyltransferase complex transferase subunit TsaD [Clostridia bacterium]|nr:tRNA (adenosine(37)-N6)-threonylcarbamoyltransferase complex transferase subunit TsaD [Clostridia bacterium]